MHLVRAVGSDPCPPPKRSAPRVLAVDDNPGVLNAINRALPGKGFEAIDVAATAAQALELARSNPRLALVDVGLGDGEPDGIDLVRDLRAAGYEGFVCMLTGYEDPGTMLRALLAGADEYLLKRCCDLGNDVEAMLARGTRPAATGPLDPERHGRFLRSAGLTGEQIEALCSYAAHGFPENKGLASLLGASESAASKLVRRAEEKLGVANRGQLVRLLTVLSGFGERERWRKEAREAERRAQRGGTEKTT
ncbi:MAG: response regulator [Proteobacteria bacterium]|jgi:DNA-binding NarL/FixJ family response regulator|nr:response regulator [Pseudomonadota bacterium]